MTSLDVAVKANPSVILAALLAVRYLEVSGMLQLARKNLRQVSSLPGKVATRLELEDSKTYCSEDIL